MSILRSQMSKPIFLTGMIFIVVIVDVISAWTVSTYPPMRRMVPKVLYPTFCSTTTTTTATTTTIGSMTKTCLGASSSSASSSAEPSKANLVNQARYLNSIERLQQEIAIAQGRIYTPLSSSSSSSSAPVYVLGRYEVPLRIDSAPGLDLTETEVWVEDDDDDNENKQGGLVLVTSVTGNAANAGLQAFDTIVGVSCKTNPDGTPLLYANVNSCDLPTTATALQAAMKYAMENNLKEIYLEMNRLMTGYYEGGDTN